MKSDFLVALTQLTAERNLPREVVLSAIEAALASAYRKDTVATGQNISVKLDPGTGDITVNILKDVVEEVEDPQQQMLLEDAQKIEPEAKIGDTVATETIPHLAGRIAAQTAKQVVMQRLREAERELVYAEFADKVGEVFSVNVQRIEPRQVIVDLGRAEAVLPLSEQSPYERYRPGQKMKVLLQTVERSPKGPEVIVSRADTVLLKRLFEMEVPEISHGAVEIVTMAREPGARSKVAVRARQDGVDPVGSCVGLRGVRIQNIVNELLGEKIDVVEWSKDTNRFISNSLSPSQVLRVDLDEETKTATAVVADRQLSLAIGKEGQNARLAAKLTGWNVDIRSNIEADKARQDAAMALAASVKPEDDLERLEISTRALNVLTKAGIAKVSQVLEMTQAELLAISSFGQKSYKELQARLKKLNLLKPAAKPPAPQVEETVVEAAQAVVEAVEAEAIEAPSELEVAEPVEAEAEPVEAGETAEEVVAAEPVAEVEAPAEAEPVEAEPEPVLAAVVPEPEPVAAEPMPVFDRSASLRDLPDNIWSLNRPGASESGQIRFAEDIVDLKGGVTARRVRRGGGGGGGRKKAKRGRGRTFRR